MNDETPHETENPDTPPESPAAESPEPAAPKQAVSPVVLTIAFIIIVLLGIVIFQNLFSRPAGDSPDSPAIKSLRADIETRRSELNRERIALGLEPLPGTSGVETTEEVAERLKRDADTLASLAASFQDLLERKELEIDSLRAESITALKEQKRLRELLSQTNADLRAAMVDASLATTIKGDLERANATIAALNEEIARLKVEPDQLRAELLDANRQINELQTRLAGLEQKARQAVLFAKSENELLKEAVALFQALRQLQGASEQELTAAYSRFGAELNATVLDTCEFATGSADVRPDLEMRLRSLPSETPANAMLFVVGYASETGNVDQNRTLSSDRATNAARILDNIKGPEQRVQAVYLGQTKRFSATVPEQNQRVEIWQIIPRVTEASLPPAPEAPGNSPPLRPVPEFR